ncbi:hypothetical protein ACFL3B_03265 [Gemmatimonadota bacterium]
MSELGITWEKPAAKIKRRPFIVRAVPWAFSLVFLVVLPFTVLVRVSTYLNTASGVQTWVALAGGVAATALVVTLYSAVLSKKLTGKARFRALAKRVALPLVLAYCAYTLLFLSSVNAKSAAVQEYYKSLHPMLRIAVSTVILLDSDIVITDLHRTPDDYVAMGLPVRAESLHYRQGDGFVHAMDLRTEGRPEWRNSAVELYFRAAGFETLRHVGTADHLHVALPVQ